MADVIIKDNSDEFMKEFYDKVDVVLEAVGIHLEGEAKEELNNAPKRIDTGLLRNSITHAISGHHPAISSYRGDNPSRYGSKYGGDGSIPSGSYTGNAPNDPQTMKAVYIGTNVKYAPYVHEGTQKMTANRFLKNAATKNVNQIKEYLIKELE